MDALAADSLVIPAQVLGELFRVLTRKARWPAKRAQAAVSDWQASASVPPTTASTLSAALDLAVDHAIPIWDAVVLSVAAEAGCRVLLSEDYAEGFTWRGLTVVNPFAPERHPLLAAALRG